MKIGFERVRFVLWFVLVVVLLTAMFFGMAVDVQ